ncbi:MAG: Ig-like domain-containing protein, partial [Chlorobiaceae bacterium]|nr:Ig-like domain-containing protein [Chlorobiaceae bacterium]
ELRSGSATGTVVESFNAATSNRLTISGAALTIDPTSNLTGNTHYFLTFASGTIKDLAGNNYAGTSSYDFTTLDTTPPTIIYFSPSNGATNTFVSGNISVTFSEAFNFQTGGIIQIHAGSATGTVFESFDVTNSTRLLHSGNILTIDPLGQMAYSTDYYITFSAGCVEDLAGNDFAGHNSYHFATSASEEAASASGFPLGTAGMALAGSAGLGLLAWLIL